MSDEPTEGIAPEQKSVLSRRAALKAGVAVGVGVAAWSGASITSLGGTPAYAQVVTGAIVIELSGGCTNTDAGAGCVPAAPFRFHTLATPPAPFTLVNNPGQGTCCNNLILPILRWTQPNLTCTVAWLMRAGQQACLTGSGTVVGGGQASGSDGVVGVTVPLDCGDITAPPNSFYRITAVCQTTAP